ncbi:P-loop containing nucleoside triphosphate hydrolase protein [Kalaharituber pfeilii]|nr:P-loop containing nucleoside triphosphate hydrolase protein [Kalaharituber pfeilii]
MVNGTSARNAKANDRPSSSSGGGSALKPGSSIAMNMPSSLKGGNQSAATSAAISSSNRTSTSLANGTVHSTPKKKRDHAEFLADNKDSSVLDSNGPKLDSSSSANPNLEPQKPLSNRALKKQLKQEQWVARIAQKEAERLQNGEPPYQKQQQQQQQKRIVEGIRDPEQHKEEYASAKKQKLGSGTGTGAREVVDQEVEFLKNKKKRKKERQLAAQNSQNNHKHANRDATQAKDIHGAKHKHEEKQAYKGPGPLTNGVTPTKAPPHTVHKAPTVNGVGGDTESDTENDDENSPSVPPTTTETASSRLPAPSTAAAASRPSQTSRPSSQKPQPKHVNKKPNSLNPNERRAILLQHRRKLPIWPYKEDLQLALRERDILIMRGETGSGKSTQLAQFLLNEPWMQLTSTNSHQSGKEYAPCIAITQPRRIAATSLAIRVAQELGVKLGEEVGYSVRFDNKSNPYKTRIKFLTDGMLLREMLDDPELRRYRAVVVDEAHERTISGDLVLGFLKKLVKKGGARSRGVAQAQQAMGKQAHGLKVVIMSATVEVEKLADFFDEQADEETLKGSMALAEGNVGMCTVEGRQFPVETFYTPAPVDDYIDAALRTIFQIHYAERMPGDMLVFLPGQEDIESLERMITEYAALMDLQEVPRLIVLPLYAALPQHLQQRVFLPPPTPNTRKVILATNIAETSITVPGVRLVIDTGKAKERQFRPRIGLESLLISPISKSSAQQRKGRAGREAPGKCYRLYTEDTFHALSENPIPEILRVDVASSVLIMKARGQNDILGFDYLDSPSRDSLIKAMETLYGLGALDNKGSLTLLGHSMAKLPLVPHLSRVLIAALEPANIDVLPEVVDIVAALSTDNVFLNIPLFASEEKRQEVEESRRQFWRREGDHLVLAMVVKGYLREKVDRRVWAQKRYISHRALAGVVDVRKQLRHLCTTLGPAEYRGGSANGGSKRLFPTEEEEEENISPEKAERILKCFLTGYFANTARLVPDGSYRTVIGNQTVTVHPMSIMFSAPGGKAAEGTTEGGDLRGQRRRTEAIMYNEFVYTTKPFARCVSAVQLDWLMDASPAYLGRARD